MSVIYLFVSQTFPEGNYCANIFGNNLQIFFNSNNNTADILANIYGSKYKCFDVNYEINSTLIYIINNTDNCLNNILDDYNLCPCPPSIEYDQKSDEVIISNDKIGYINLLKC